MKKLFLCETPFQIIMALCLKQQCANSNDQVDVIIADTFNGYKNISNRIKELKLFNNVYNANINIEPAIKKIKKIKYVIMTKNFLREIFEGKIELYDELFFWNYNYYTISIKEYLSRKNKNMKSFVFEEGYISYFSSYKKKPTSFLMKLVNIKNVIMKHQKIYEENMDGIYLFEPDLLLYKPACTIFKIDRKTLETKKFQENIKYIFNIDDVILKYDKKYIIFEECHPEYDDEKIFDEIIERVGKDNVIIKLHPRRKINRFAKKGVKTLGNDGAPWEAIALAKDFSKNVLISIGSGSITSHRMLFGNNMNAYLLFKFCGSDLEEFNEKNMKFWNKLESKNDNHGIHIPDTLEQFYAMLDKEKREV